MTLFIAVNFLFFVIGNNIATHFRILQVDWRNYDFSSNKFEELVDRHLKIFDCCDLFKKIYAPLLLIKFGTMAVVIGLLGFETIIVGIFIVILFEDYKFLRFLGPRYIKKSWKFFVRLRCFRLLISVPFYRQSIEG
jgi:hypothetical protein